MFWHVFSAILWLIFGSTGGESTAPRPCGPNEVVQCVASYYAEPFHGRTTANMEIYDMNELTAAHKTLPFNTMVWVTNLSNGRKVLVRINDRGPYI
jgi:rare lipoprotein A (peptidoglycan hydrolase)